MSKFKMDAVEIASSIHKGDFSKLRGKSFEMCDNKNMKGKYTLNELGTTVDQLGIKVNNLGSTVDKLGMIVDKLVTTVDALAKEMRDGFKQVNSRIDKIDARLDYIVEANNLKDLPKSK